MSANARSVAGVEPEVVYRWRCPYKDCRARFEHTTSTSTLGQAAQHVQDFHGAPQNGQMVLLGEGV